MSRGQRSQRRHPRQVVQPGTDPLDNRNVSYPVIDPEPEFLSEPYEAYQHRAAAAALQEGPTMTTTPARDLSAAPEPPLLPQTDVIAKEVVTLRQEVGRLIEAVDRGMPVSLEAIWNELSSLRAEVEVLGMRPKKGVVWQPDALDWQLIEILRHVYPMAVDAAALVSAGLACSESTALSRAVLLGEHNMIEVEYRSQEDRGTGARRRRRFRALPEKS